MGLILLIVLLALLLGGLPAWPYSRSWGYRPTWIFSILLIILILMMLTGNMVFIRA